MVMGMVWVGAFLLSNYILVRVWPAVEPMSLSPASVQVEVDELQSSLARLHVEEEKTENSIGSLHSKEREMGLKVESLRAEVGRLVAEEMRYSVCYMSLC